MDTAGKLQLLIDRLSAANDAGKLRWARGIRPEAYQTSFPNASVILEKSYFAWPQDRMAELRELRTKGTATSFRPVVRLRVLDGSGGTVTEISAQELEVRGDGQRASLLKQLYERARYEVVGERVIDELLASLAAEAR